MPRIALVIGLLLSFIATPLAAEAPLAWPPALKGAVHGTVSLSSPQLLEIPEIIRAEMAKEDSAPFDVARTAPRVELALHDQLGPNAAERRLWSSWGDICVARDGRVYCAIGDHGNDVGGDARCFIYRWDPQTKRLEQIVDMNQVVPPQPGQPAWSKVHAKIDEGPDGNIYFSCTLNDGNRAKLPSHGFNDKLPGGQLYQFNPTTGRTTVFANLPPRRCTATSLVDTERGIWWCNLEAGEGNALFALDLKTKQVVYQGKDGSVGFNRSFGLLRDGSILFNGDAGVLQRLNAQHKIVPTASTVPGSNGMRAVSAETRDHRVYGTTYKTNQLFEYAVDRDELKLLGPTFLTGSYTTLTLLSSDEKYVYYLPGSHGGAFKHGTPIVQFNRQTQRRKVLAFLAPVCEREFGYVPAGTYGAKLSADGSTLYVNFNGHPVESLRPKKLTPNGFGLCSFAAIHIPASERE